MESPLWCFVPESRERFWSILRNHRVTAYLRSHVIAFDFRVQGGIPQITSGGGGTDYGPGTFMPGATEYLHAAQISVDRSGLRFQVVGTDGSVRESGAWPLPEPAAWTQGTIIDTNALSSGVSLIVSITNRGRSWDPVQGAGPFEPEVPRLASIDGRFVLGVEVVSGRLFVDLELDPYGRQRWSGPERGFRGRDTPGVEVAFHPRLGPGGVLARLPGEREWTSMFSSSAAGLEAFRWPGRVTLHRDTLTLRHAIVEVC